MIVRAYRYNGKGFPERMGTIDDIELLESDFEDGKFEFVQNEKTKHLKRRFLKESGFAKIHKFYPDWDWEDSYSYLGIVSEETLEFEAEQKWRHEYYIKIVTDAMREGKSITNITRYKGLTDKCSISPEYLIHYGWSKYENPILKSLSEEEKNEIGFDEYKMDIVDEEHLDKCWFITMRYQLSNTPNREWSCHIDNGWHESIACVDIGTIEQFNMLMNLMSVEYRLR